MRYGTALLSSAIVVLLVLSSGCLGGDDEPEVKVELELMGEKAQNVIQGNNTTFLFAIENNWKDNATLVVSVEKVPDDWSVDLLPPRAVLEKFTGTSVRVNISSPWDAKQKGYEFKIKLKAQGSDVHKDSQKVRVFILDSKVSPELDIVKDGGKVVYMNYTGYLSNGEVFDTNHENTSLSSSIPKAPSYQPRSSYDPTPFRPGSGQMITGFEAGIMGMRQGESKSFFIPEGQAYSDWQDLDINITEEVPLREKWSSNEFGRAFREEPAMWMVVTHRKWNWTAQVVSIDLDEQSTVTLLLQVEPGDETWTYGWKSVVLSVDSTANGGEGVIILDNNPDEDGPVVGGPAQIYNASAPVEYDFGNVTEMTDTIIKVRIQRSHHDLAGEDLIFYVKVDHFQDA
jgi:FKBP-type peptidyl-prolyl cis-trans isomerase 2